MDNVSVAEFWNWWLPPSPHLWWVMHICFSKYSDSGLAPSVCSAPSHYLNQWWFVADWSFVHKFQWNWNEKKTIMVQGVPFENVFRKISVILFRFFVLICITTKRVFLYLFTSMQCLDRRYYLRTNGFHPFAMGLLCVGWTFSVKDDWQGFTGLQDLVKYIAELPFLPAWCSI